MKLIGLDTETTGLNAQDHRIIEIALMRYDSETQLLEDSLVLRIHPQRSIDPKAQAVHGISINDLKDCPTFKEVARDITRFIKTGDLLIAHNLGFDVEFLVEELLRAEVDVPQIDGFDTLDARWATPLGKKPSLKELCFALDVPYDVSLAHAATYDVDVMMQCFFKAVERGFFVIESEAEDEGRVAA